MSACRTISIKVILIAGFGGLMVAGIALSLFFGLSAAFHNTRQYLTETSETAIDIIIGEIDTRLRPVEAQGRWMKTRIQDGWLDARNLDPELASFFFDAAMSATPQVSSVALIEPNGIMHQWRRDSGMLPPEDWSDDEGFMRWVGESETRTEPGWGPPFWLDSFDGAVIIHDTTLFDDEGYMGILAFAVSISDLSRQIAGISETAFVLAGRDNVLAHPLMIDWRPINEASLPSAEAIYAGQSALMPLTELGDGVLERIWSADYEDLPLLPSQPGVHAVAADVGDRQYVYLYREIPGYGPDDWAVGMYLDVTEAEDVILRLQNALWAGGGVFVIAVILGLFLTRALVKPIRSLARASEAVRDGRFDSVPALPDSHIQELNSALSSFSGMVDGLAEREVIRRTLGRYVPEKIAETLLKDDGGLEPTEAEATILFADVAGFTSLTEALGPTRIVEVLNAYFSRMTEIIEAHGGVITQFQGDAILAIFNVPIPAEDHAEQACRAAIEMRAAIASEVFAGQRISARIGINTGLIVAGAVGAEGRLTYTVHGDAVNRAARVEAMNKELGTELLVAGATANLQQTISARKVGTMQVRGQSEAVTVYTIDE